MTRPEVAETAHGWRALFTLHSHIEDRLERALQLDHQLSLSEYSVLETLALRAPQYVRMQTLASAVALSQSATTRLVARLERRDLLIRRLCQEDRRGINTEITDAGQIALNGARPTHHRILTRALTEAGRDATLAPLVAAIRSTPSQPAPTGR